MKVVHIAVAGITDKFYLNFLSKLGDVLEMEQYLYIPYKKGYSEKDMDIVAQYNKNEINTIALPIKTNIDRILYYKKIKKYMKYLEKSIDIKEISIMHAHSLFSDGGVAYLLYKKYGIPYIVAVRTTDTYGFMKYFRHLIPFGRKIIQNASEVVFITPSLKSDTISIMFGKSNKAQKMFKSQILPNGVNEYWIKNKMEVGKKLDNDKKVHLIQVSRLNPRKNVDKTIAAVKLLRNRGIDATLDILGEGNQRETLESIAKKLGVSQYVTFHGFIDNLNAIKLAYEQNDIFVMPSLGETFGITYIEAMSQGLPIVGIQGTGVSDFFENGQVGQFIAQATDTQIAEAVMIIAKNYEALSKNCIQEFLKFDWNHIVKEYQKIYSGIKKDKTKF